MAAYDGSRQSDPHQPPYPVTYDQTYDPRTHHSASYEDLHYHEPSRPRSRASSNAPSNIPQQPPHSVLNNAFDKSDIARGVDPELIAQITAEVKKSVLDEIKLNGVGVGAPTQPAPAPAQQYIPQSPTSMSASFPSRNLRTPPSPSPKHPDYSSHGSTSPDPLARDPMFDGAGDTPTLREHSRSAPVDIPNDRPCRARPAAASRMSYDFTPIEKMWQHLFDPQGQPTPRLGQFLRGLAIHLIDDYEPKKSLVIAPYKMLRFYNDAKVHDENFPWHTIFGTLAYPNLTKIYRDLRCEHHLIQEHLVDLPQVPALTPKGFETWMTAMIQAHPDTEYERLSKAVLDMPISNADDFKERFPKELPRRLFPNQENLQAQQRCAAVLSVEGVGPLRRAPTFPPPPPMGHSSGLPPSLERERSPYASRPADPRAIESDDEDNSPLSIPIERERKPYSSVPGSGKVYEDGLSQSMHSNASNHDHHKRAQSTAIQSQWTDPSHSRTWSQANHDRRSSNPSFSTYGTRSDHARDIPGSYLAYNLYDSEEENHRVAKEAETKRNEWARRQAEEDPAASGHHRRSTTETDSSYDSQPRSVYDDDHSKSRTGSNVYDSGGYEPRRY